MVMEADSGRRRRTHEVRVGNIGIGGQNPVRVQSMCTTSTMDTDGCVQQILAIAKAGGELVRLTTQGVREAENMRVIRERVRAAGCDVPLVADVHFNPAVAEVAARYCEKVRINPGNYVDAARKFKHLEYTDEEYAAELLKIEERLIPFLNICREHGTAVRIGVNHGSLSDRIMSRYGDTPEGIVESCMEFLRICIRENFLNVVVSIKASNTVVMVQSVRLLCKAMDAENMTFPLHLGVTEAGEGEDGRLKSAVGIGALLIDGIGDTIRVSLSEAPENEIPVAYSLLQAARLRQTKTEYISCPGCGRTLYNMQETIHRIKAATAHLTGLKIAIMGCIVNGPGEMADADYGYVGAARGKVSLYRGKECVEKNIPEEEAVQRLLDLIGPSPRSPRGGEGRIADENATSDNILPPAGGVREGLPSYMTADTINYHLLKDFARENRYHPTEAESILWNYLKGYSLHYPFRRQHIIGNFIADFVCLPKKLIIEIDGGYHQLPEQQISDEERTLWLEQQGFKLIRFTNEEIIGNIETVINKITEYLK
ncbi:MAG: (E)-4-hydroxy-3-methylbut-2-enyl-diphosphate synthase [Bacteroidaceae bacterium]|nr:(E)-4-hydroxy-3-methylbut-2-enyl-diphosphate synthase [Bacteroidaceae bacterium]